MNEYLIEMMEQDELVQEIEAYCAARNRVVKKYRTESYSKIMLQYTPELTESYNTFWL